MILTEEQKEAIALTVGIRLYEQEGNNIPIRIIRETYDAMGSVRLNGLSFAEYLGGVGYGSISAARYQEALDAAIEEAEDLVTRISQFSELLDELKGALAELLGTSAGTQPKV